jgi:glyoxylase-like metal-dependent hydrolase (beta-lactamase superfamily II)
MTEMLQAARPLRILFIALAAAAGSFAQTPAQHPVAIRADLVKTGLYVLYGGGGNSLLRLTANGLIVVDGKQDQYEALMKAVNRIEEQRVRVLINTNPRPEHSGNNAQFLRAGAAILGQQNAGNTAEQPLTKTYDREFTLRGGGIEVKLLHFGSARTNADTVVYFPDLKVVAVGDLLADAAEPDYSLGGSIVGWVSVLDQIVKLDFDTVVASSGLVRTRADVEAFRTRVDRLVSRASGLVKNGVPKEQLMSRLNTDHLGMRLDLTGDRLDRFYAELSKTE